MEGAYEIVMENRKELVEKIVGLMKEGMHGNHPEWDSSLFRPHNPLSKVFYKGGNRIRLLMAAYENGYKDYRWATLKQYADQGYYPNKGEKGILCEKWIFTQEKTVINERGKKEKIIVELEKPKVSYFKVFNAEQIKGFPVSRETPRQGELEEKIRKIRDTSECPIQEREQGRAYYSVQEDCIVLPLKAAFKDEASFIKTMLHEMGHSTGHPERLNRNLKNFFGSPGYAKEELRAEIASVFTGADFEVPLTGEHYEDHSDYLLSWIAELEHDYNEFFRACADAEKITQRLVKNYLSKYPSEELHQGMEVEKYRNGTQKQMQLKL